MCHRKSKQERERERERERVPSISLHTSPLEQRNNNALVSNGHPALSRQNLIIPYPTTPRHRHQIRPLNSAPSPHPPHHRPHLQSYSYFSLPLLRPPTVRPNSPTNHSPLQHPLPRLLPLPNPSPLLLPLPPHDHRRHPPPPEDYTFPSLLKACANARSLAAGHQAHASALKLAMAKNKFVRPTLINMYAECGDLRSSRLLFDRGAGNCVVSYNSMITDFVRGSRPGEALALLRELQAKGLRPTDITLLKALAACALLGAIELGRWIHEYVNKNWFDKYVKVNTALIDMYAKCGSLEDAVRAFESMGWRDTQAWSAMITAYAIHGHESMAISLLEEMLRAGTCRPDGITFLGVLYACSHLGVVDKGLEYFRTMRSLHHVVPGIKHYGCLVDLLARAGRLDEAYEFIDKLPIKPRQYSGELCCRPAEVTAMLSLESLCSSRSKSLTIPMEGTM